MPGPVSVLFNESKLLKSRWRNASASPAQVSVLFNESKLLKFVCSGAYAEVLFRFSTLQRVEIAEILRSIIVLASHTSFSTLQRVEIAEIA